MENPSVEARPLFPGTLEAAFLDAACVGIVPRPAARAVRAFLDKIMVCDARDASLHHVALDQERQVPVAEAAKLFRVDEERVALIESTTHGLNIAADAIPLREGDSVLVADTEFLQVPLPWKTRGGVRIRPVRAEEPGFYTTADFVGAMDETTRVVCVSTVQWCTGYRIDTRALARACRDRGIWLVADAIHEAGVMDVDLSEGLVDFYVTGGHKWLNAPFGCGFMILSDRVLSELEPRSHGYLTLEEPEDGWTEYFQTPSITPYREFQFPPTAKSFEIGGTGNYPGAVGLGQTLKLANDFGIGEIDAYVRSLGRKLREMLAETRARIVSPADERHRAGITVFRWGETPGEDRAVLEGLLDRDVLVSLRYTSGMGGIRVSTHYYNDEDDLAALMAALEDIAV